MRQIVQANAGRWGVLAALAALTVGLQAVLIHWYIEDAAISFAYARNWAAGDGLVTYAGGERVEGFSNPAWVALMALGHLVGIDAFTSSKAMGFVFGALTVPLVAGIAAQPRTEADGRPRRDAVALYAAAFLTVNAQFVIWNASGLENSLVSLALAAAVYRALVEQQPGRWPLSPLFWLVLTITRPEGIAYAALGGFWQMVWSLRDGRGLGPTLRWLAAFWLPFGAYFWLRYDYFAWAFPNTYYAKNDRGDFQPFGWNVKGWKYLRGWAWDLGQAWLIPVYLLAITGARRTPALLGGLAALWLAVFLWPGSATPSVDPLLKWLHPDLKAGLVASITHLPKDTDALATWGVSRALWLLLGLGAAAWVGRSWRRGSRTLIDVVLAAVVTWSLPVVAVLAFDLAQAISEVAGPSDREATHWATAALLVPGLFALGLGAGLALTARRLLPEARAALWIGFGLVALRGALWGFEVVAPEQWSGWRFTAAHLRAGTLFLVALAAPALAWGRREARGLVLSWQLAVFSLFFALWSGGDWMKQYRWMASLAVPASVLLAHGLAVLQDAAQRRFGGATRERWTAPAHLIGLAALVAFATVQIHNLAVFGNKPETSPFSVQKRVNYKKWVARRLHIDEPVVDLDVDQGAHVWWSGWRMRDIAGLVEVPMAHHQFEKPFIREYMFHEMRPHFAHVHGGWASNSKIPTHPEWKQQYLEIPGYPSAAKAKTVHVGNFVRRDLFIRDQWGGPADRRVAFEEDVVLEGFAVPSDVAGQGMHLYVEVGMRTSRDRSADETFRVVLFLSDAAGHVLSWDLPPGYDWWEVGDWTPGEVFFGRFSLPIPADAPEGTWDVGVAVFGKDGHLVRPVGAFPPPADGSPPAEVLPAGAVAGGIGDAPARFAIGEVRFPAQVQIVPRAVVAERAQDDLDAARDAATAGDCDGAESRWLLAKRRFTWDAAWEKRARPTVATEIARCWARRAAAAGDTAVHDIDQARVWDFRDPEVLAVGAVLADQWMSDGLTARKLLDWEAAYAAFSRVLVADPQRSWARRYAEEARDHRLKIGDAEDAAAAERRDKPKKPKGRRGMPMPGGGVIPVLPSEVDELIAEPPPPAEDAPLGPDGAGEE